MRKLLLIALLSVFACTIAVNEVAAKPNVTIKLDIGRKKFNCEKFGICAIDITATWDERPGVPPSSGLENIGGNQMNVFISNTDVSSQVTDKADFNTAVASGNLTIDEDIRVTVPAQYASALKCGNSGYVTIKKGTYSLKKVPNGYQVTVRYQ